MAKPTILDNSYKLPYNIPNIYSIYLMIFLVSSDPPIFDKISHQKLTILYCSVVLSCNNYSMFPNGYADEKPESFSMGITLHKSIRYYIRNF
jgi:hypothetical protein